MNKRPVSYLQTDARWSKLPYQVKGETATIGGSGCGPTAAAMLIETMTCQTFTPVDACKWSVDHGYKALNQGTYFGYFVAQFAAFGIGCRQLLGARLSNQPAHPIHDQVREYLAQGYYVIALMGPKDVKTNVRGTWTGGGHFVVLWGWDGKVRINDPASTKDNRVNGDPDTFRREARNYWLIDARKFNEEMRDLTEKEVRAVVRDELAKAQAELAKAPADKWAVPHIEACVRAGVMANVAEEGQAPMIDRPKAPLTRQEAAVMAAAMVQKN